MNSATFAILVASLVGSVHCAAMCGGITCFYANGGGSKSLKSSKVQTVRVHALYNIGRLIAYVTLGTLAGALGGHVTHLAAWIGIARGATIVAGILMILWASSHLISHAGVRIQTIHVPLRWQQAIGSLLTTLRDQQPATRAVATGLLTGLIPCGWLYVFVSTAGASGAPLSGAGVMAIFWLGTVPALVAVGVGAQSLLAPLRAHLPRLSAAVVLIIGLMAVSGRLVLSHVH